MHTLANRTWIAVCVAGGLALGMVACGGSSDSGGNGAGASAGAGGTGGAGDGGAGAGGSAQTGGTGGTGGTEEPIAHADKVDLLIMVDNSVSMADKQAVVAQTVPDLVARLTNPDCFDPATGQFVAQVEPGQDCPAGSERAFPPVTDMHLGVITSSLGGHGADACSPTGVGTYNPHQEDMAHLIARTDSGGTVATYGDKGYLNWDPKGASSPPAPRTLRSSSSRSARWCRVPGRTVADSNPSSNRGSGSSSIRRLTAAWCRSHATTATQRTSVADLTASMLLSSSSGRTSFAKTRSSRS
jgi:hypothetical protein